MKRTVGLFVAVLVGLVALGDENGNESLLYKGAVTGE